MGDQPRPKPPSRAGKGPTAGSFKPGDPRINRSGRPRAGTAFSERGRERIDPDAVLDLAVRVMDDESIPPRERLAIVMPVVDRIFVKPLVQTETTLKSGDAPNDIDWTAIPVEERKAELARIQERIKALQAKYAGGAADTRVTDPPLDEESHDVAPSTVTSGAGGDAQTREGASS